MAAVVSPSRSRAAVRRPHVEPTIQASSRMVRGQKRTEDRDVRAIRGHGEVTAPAIERPAQQFLAPSRPHQSRAAFTRTDGFHRLIESTVDSTPPVRAIDALGEAPCILNTPDRRQAQARVTTKCLADNRGLNVIPVRLGGSSRAGLRDSPRPEEEPGHDLAYALTTPATSLSRLDSWLDEVCGRKGVVESAEPRKRHVPAFEGVRQAQDRRDGRLRRAEAPQP